MNYKKGFFILILVFLPLKVHANIICNDGTRSATCANCHQGCCSRHGGCTADAQNNDSNYNYGSNSYQENTNVGAVSEQSTPSVQSDDSSNNEVSQSQTNETPAIDDNATVQETIPSEKTDVSDDKNVSNESSLNQNNDSSDEEISDDAVEGFLGLWGTGAIGAATYAIIKNKRRK